MAFAASARGVQPFHRVNLPEKTLLFRLVTLYNEATNWYTRQQILSVFVGDYSKTKLLSFISLFQTVKAPIRKEFGQMVLSTIIEWGKRGYMWAN